MIIRSASFVRSSLSLKQCPPPLKPEFGFVGRSNVGKSSLINMLTGLPKLAKTSGTPGKTTTINYFIINGDWYLVDLPGYGYAKVPHKIRDKWMKAVEEYILKRETLTCLFVLIDSRHEPMGSDLSFMEFLGNNQVPFARVFTKADKLPGDRLLNSVRQYDKTMLGTWESLPPAFITSARQKRGRDELLDFIQKTINNL